MIVCEFQAMQDGLVHLCPREATHVMAVLSCCGQATFLCNEHLLVVTEGDLQFWQCNGCGQCCTAEKGIVMNYRTIPYQALALELNAGDLSGAAWTGSEE